MPPALYANGQHGMILKERQIDPTRRCDGTEDIMSIFLTILAVVIAVPIGLLIWMAIGVKRSMNRNDNRKE